MSDMELWEGCAKDVVARFAQALREERKQKRVAEQAEQKQVQASAKEVAQDLLSTRRGLQRIPCTWRCYPHLCPQMVALSSSADMDDISSKGAPGKDGRTDT